MNRQLYFAYDERQLKAGRNTTEKVGFAPSNATMVVAEAHELMDTSPYLWVQNNFQSASILVSVL